MSSQSQCCLRHRAHSLPSECHRQQKQTVGRNTQSGNLEHVETGVMRRTYRPQRVFLDSVLLARTSALATFPRQPTVGF